MQLTNLVLSFLRRNVENVFPFRSIILKMVIRKWNDTIRVGFHYDEKIVSSLLGWKSFALLVYLRFDTNFVFHLIFDIMMRQKWFTYI